MIAEHRYEGTSSVERAALSTVNEVMLASSRQDATNVRTTTSRLKIHLRLDGQAVDHRFGQHGSFPFEPTIVRERQHRLTRRPVIANTLGTASLVKQTGCSPATRRGGSRRTSPSCRTFCVSKKVGQWTVAEPRLRYDPRY